jgi:hypothetical protein
MENTNHTMNDTDPVDDSRAPFDQFVYHQRKALEETGKAIDALVPPGFKEHGAEAGREFAKGFKVLVDAAISELERMSKEMERRQQEAGNDRPSTTGPNKVKVQVE